MYVAKEKKIGVLLNGNDQKILILNKNLDDLEELSNYDLVISNIELMHKSIHTITSPGEYEVKGILVNTNSNSSEEKSIHFAEIVFENITILYCFSNFKFNDNSYKEIEDVDVLILDESISSLDIQKLINRFDPEYFIVTAINPTIEKLLNDAGIGKSNSEKKLKIKSEEFGNEDYILQNFVLE